MNRFQHLFDEQKALFASNDRGGAVNQTNIHLFIETMPFGGVGPAGIGHYYGREGYNMLTHAKAMLISPPEVSIDHLFPPYTDEKNRELATWFDY
jgi:aldehyde dehydrogenase (NAD+)